MMSEASSLGLGAEELWEPRPVSPEHRGHLPMSSLSLGDRKLGEALVPVHTTAGQSDNMQRHSLSQGTKQGRGGGGGMKSHQGQVAGGAAGNQLQGPGPQAEVVI